MEKKYVIVKSGERVKMGDTLVREYNEKTTFGTIIIKEKYTLTPETVEELIEKKIIQPIQVVEGKKLNLDSIVNTLATKLDCDLEDTVALLTRLNAINPKIVLNILLQLIADAMYDNDPDDFNKVDCYYSLRHKDGKVGKVINLNPYITLFKSKEDAETARKILKDQLKFMYGNN